MPFDQKKIISTNQPPRTYSADKLDAYVQGNIKEYTDGQLRILEDKIEEKISSKETRTTEILAIFITLFTFISVNINIFTRVQDLHTAIWFLLLITACSILLVSILFLLISNRRNWYIITIILISIITLFGLLVATKYIPSWNPQLNKVEVERG